MSTLMPPSALRILVLILLAWPGIACHRAAIARAEPPVGTPTEPPRFQSLLDAAHESPYPSRQVETLLSQAQANNQLKAWAPAARQYVQAHPEDAAASCLLGRILTLLGETEPARQIIEATLKANQDFAPAHAASARWHMQQRNWEDALATAKMAIEKGLDDAETHLLAARIFDALDQAKDAEKEYLLAFSRDPKDPVPLMEHAESLERIGKRSRCERVLRQILEDVDPRFMLAREKLIWLHLGADNLDKAQAFFEGFKKLNQTGPIVERCEAYLRFRTSTDENRLKQYADDLRRIVKTYPKDVRSRVDLAMISLAEADMETSLAHAEKALKIDPTDFATRELKAAILKRLLRYDETAELYRGLLRDRPNSIAWQRALKEVSLIREDYDTAISILRGLLKREKPDEVRNLRPLLVQELLQALVEAGKTDEAVTLAESWLEKAPTDPTRQQYLLEALHEADRKEATVKLARRWLAKDPTNLDLRIQFVNILSDAKRFAEAKRTLVSWLEEKPDHPILNRLLIYILWSEKDWQSAMHLAKAGMDIEADRDFYRSLLEVTYTRAGQYDKAVELYQEDVETLIEHGSYSQIIAAHQTLIQTLIRAERYVEAEQIANNLLQAQLAQQETGAPHDVALILDMRRILATIYQDTDRLPQAIDELEAVYRVDPTDIGINNDLGYIWADAGQHLDEARTLVRHALSQRPREAAYLDSMGWVLYKQGDFNGAIAYLERAIHRSASPDPILHDHMGDAFYRAGKNERAKEQWQTAEKLCDPESNPRQGSHRARLHEKIAKKLKQLADDERVKTSPAGEAELSTSQPATQASENATSQTSPTSSTSRPAESESR